MAVGSQSIDAHRETIAQNTKAADEADSNRDFLTEAYQNGEFDVTEAADRGILTGTEEPAEGVTTITPDSEGKATFPTAAGGETTVDLNDRAQSLGQRAAALREGASRSARSVKRIKAAQSAAKVPDELPLRLVELANKQERPVSKLGRRVGLSLLVR